MDRATALSNMPNLLGFLLQFCLQCKLKVFLKIAMVKVVLFMADSFPACVFINRHNLPEFRQNSEITFGRFWQL